HGFFPLLERRSRNSRIFAFARNPCPTALARRGLPGDDGKPDAIRTQSALRVAELHVVPQAIQRGCGVGVLPRPAKSRRGAKRLPEAPKLAQERGPHAGARAGGPGDSGGPWPARTAGTAG